MYRWGDVRQWRSAPLGTAGDGLGQDLKVLEKSRDTVAEQAIPDSWTGLARMWAQLRQRTLVARMDKHLEGKRRMRRALYTAETEVAEIERRVTDVEGQARNDEFTIDGDGTVTDASTPPTFEHRWQAEEWRTTRQNRAQAIADEIGAILTRAAAADAGIADAVPVGHTTTVDEYGTASPEVAARWSQLTDAERRAVIEEMIEELSAESGLDMPTIEWMDESWGPNGQWSESDGGTVRLNEGLLDDPRILHTVAHEVRHGRQYEAIRDANDNWNWPWEDDPFDEHEDDGITREQASTWEENFDDYQSTSNPGVSYEDYFTQPVEEDARDAGREFLDGLTEDELDRLLEEAS